MKHLALFCAFLLIGSLSVSAQGKLSSDRKKHIPVLAEEADILFSAQNYYRALPRYLELMQLDSSEYYYEFQAGICYLYTDDRDNSLSLFKKVEASAPDMDDLYYYLGRAYHLNYEFDTAIMYFQKYLKTKSDEEKKRSAENYINYCNNAKYFISDPDRVEIINLGPFVNTSASEYAPVISGDESEIIYTYRGPLSTGGLEDLNFNKDTNGEYYEDIFKVQKVGLNWVAPEKINDLDTKSNDASIALSVDGQTLFTFKSTEADGGDIYVSKLDGVHWTKPERLGPNVNTKYWEGSCSLSSDGKTLYFASERPGGFGGRDIYSSKLQKDGSWGPAHNLGSKINTNLNDDAPFIHPDGSTLFFSSEGWNSMGGYDIFYSSFNMEDSVWNTPVNMGYPINSSDDDRYYVLTPDGKYGYFSSNRQDGFGQQDLYVVTPGFQNKRPTLALTIGVVMLDDSPVKAEIKVTDMKTDKEWGHFQSNSTTGKYIVALAAGTKYKIAIEIKGLNPHIEYVDVDSLRSFIRIEDSVHLYTDAYKKRHNAVASADTVNVMQKMIVEKMKAYFAKEDSDCKKTYAYLRVLNKYGLADSSGINYTVQLGRYRNPADFDSTRFAGSKISRRIDKDGYTVFYVDSIHRLIDAERLKYKVIEYDSNMAKAAEVTVNNKGQTENFDQFYAPEITQTNKAVAATINTSNPPKSDSNALAKSTGTEANKTNSAITSANTKGSNQSKTDNTVSTKPSKPENIEAASNYDTVTHIGNIHYALAGWNIAYTAVPILHRIIKMMKADTCIEMDLYSYADPRGTAEYNMGLSQKRANSAKNYLVANGIKPSRIISKGYGKTNLLNNCDDPNGHFKEADYAINRRTEFKILKRDNCK